MKVVILAGGFGTRLSEETELKPKPMVEIGQKPILWHIMKIYASHGINDFIICCGYKGYYIKEYFYNYALHNSNIEFKVQEIFTPEKNRTELIVERAFALLMVLEKSRHQFKPSPALGYYGIMATDKKVQHAIATGKLQSWNCDKIISDHSAIKTPNSAQRVLYKKIVDSIGF